MKFDKWLGFHKLGTSVQTILTYPFVFLIMATVILTGLFSFYQNGKAIDLMAGQLMDKVTDQIRDRIMLFLDRAHLVNEINANAIEAGQIDPKKMTPMEVHFWNQVRSFEYISYSYLGSADGGFWGARRLADGTLQVIATKTLTGGEISYFNTDDRGRPMEVSSTLPYYDHKTRPWYKSAIQEGKPTWSPVFVDAGGEGLTITAAKPLYDVAGKTKGVLGSSFIFSNINQFLRSLKIGKSGQTFIMERSGMLVATSTSDPTSTANKKRIAAMESENPLIRHASQLISERFGGMSGIDREQRLSIDINGERHFVYLTPFHDGRGIDWLISVMVPENDFMSSIKENHRNTILLSLIALILTIMAGFMISRRITQPILELNRAARSLASGEWSQVIEIDRRDEIGELTKSFNLMARQLRDAIDNLEQKVAERTAETMEISGKHLASEKKYRELHENLRDGSAMVDMDGKIKEFNTAFKKLLGYTAEEIHSLKFADITPARWQAMEKEILTEQVLKRGYSDPYEKEYIKKDGTIFPIEISTYLVRDENTSGFWAFIRDITERKLAEEKSQNTLNFLQTLINTIPSPIFCKDINGLYQDCNKEFEAYTGFRKEDIIGKSVFDMYTQNVAEKYHEMDLALIRQPGRQIYEYPIIYPDGSKHDVVVSKATYLNADGTLAGLVGVMLDITERKRAEESLRETQRRLTDIIELLPDATFVIDRDGKVIAWNRAIENMTGVRKEDMLGKDNYEYALPFYGERRPILIDLALSPVQEKEKTYTPIQRTGDIIFGEDYTPALAPGNIHLSATASVLKDSRGEIVGAIECIRNNTDRKNMEERLQRAERMESLGVLAGGVAHDLNNVLGILVGYSELLLQNVPKEGLAEKYAKNILRGGERAAAIIQDLLTMARRGVSVSDTVNLNQIVADSFKTPEFELVKSHHPDILFRSHVQKDLLNIKGSPVHLSKTIMNLLSNAAESIRGVGEVTITTENRYVEVPIPGYENTQEGEYVVLTVTDTGSGISPEDIGRIFEPFYTKKIMGRSGTGLGLAVVWGTVKDHNGYIDVSTEENKGSTFTLYFPVTRDALSKLDEALSQDEYQGHGETILIVDDVEEQRFLAATILGNLDYRVVTVVSGEDAVEYLRTKKADLIVLDMIMDPGIDGLETYRRVMEIQPRQKAIIVSGFAKTKRVSKAQELGAGEYVMKPYVIEKLGVAVRKELGRR